MANEQTEFVSISAKPTITRVWPDTSAVGHSMSIAVQGYNFQFTKHLYVSASPGVYTTPVTAFSPYDPSFPPFLSGDDIVSPGSSLSALYPTFSGIEVKVEDYYISSPNTMIFTLCATQGEGDVNIIIVNDAGYSDFEPFMDMGPLSGVTRTVAIIP